MKAISRLAALKSCFRKSRPIRRRAIRRRTRLLHAEVLEDRIVLSAFIVTSTADTVDASDGVTTLREAIIGANNNGGTDTIEFNISTSDAGYDAQTDAFTIQPQTDLPNVTESVIVDGYTQAGASPNTLVNGNDAVLKIEIDGSGFSATVVNGLTIVAENVTVRGLVINGFSGSGILLRTVDWTIGHGGNQIIGNFLGTDVSGTAAVPNDHGIRIHGSEDNRIGSADPAHRNVDPSDRNVISGNDGAGVSIEHAAGTVVQNNFIGTDASGWQPLGNHDGVLASANGILVGGTAAGAGNVISSNARYGIGAAGAVVIQGNFVGTDVTGTRALGNGEMGMRVQGADALVGGTEPGAGNLISANRSYGVQAVNSTNLRVQGNLIGTDVTGTTSQDPNGKLLGTTRHAGVAIHAGSDAIIGGTTATARNIISGNGQGVDLRTAGARVQGNYIGTDITGTVPLGNHTGIYIAQGATGNLVGGSAAGAGNVISGSTTLGVSIVHAGASGNRVQGNLIGTAADGQVSTAAGWSHKHGSDPDVAELSSVAGLGNGTGVMIHSGANANFVGTDGNGVADDAEGNVIADNREYGVLIRNSGTNHNIVAGNSIGIDRTGAAAGNGIGVSIDDGAGHNRAERNVISANSGDGVIVDGHDNGIAGNIIGADATGLLPMGNGGNGVLIRTIFSDSVSNRIGTDGDGIGDEDERNVISGNALDGVRIEGSETKDNVVAGNFIGTDVTGTVALANNWQGVRIHQGAQRNLVGTDADGIADAAERNVISGNGVGIALQGRAALNVVAGNFIGTDRSGEQPLGNHVGVAVFNGSRDNQIGGSPELANTIAFNDEVGVLVGTRRSFDSDQGDAVDNSIRANSIHSNGALGIDLDPTLIVSPNAGDGVTANEAGDVDAGPNGLQNFPVIDRALTTGATAKISGQINCTPFTTLTLDFYANTDRDPSGHGEGERWLGSKSVTTDVNGNATFIAVLSADTAAGEWLTATATGPEGTSEFSAAEEAVFLVSTEAPGNGQMTVNLNGSQTMPVAILTTDTFDAGTADVSTVVFAGAAPAQWRLDDVDSDGDLDLLMNFRLDETNLLEVYKDLLRDDLNDGTLDSTRQQFVATLTGETDDGKKFLGLESLDLFMAGHQLQDLLDELS